MGSKAGYYRADDQEPQVYYASQCGVAFDGSDQSSAVQAMANRGQSGPIKIILDGATIRLKGIKLYSGTTIEGLGNATVVTQAMATSIDDSCIFRNANFRSAYLSAAIVDQNITIRNMYLDGNSRGGSSGTADRRFDPSSFPANIVRLYGCNGFLLENLYCYDPCTWAIGLSNVFGGVARNITAVDPDVILHGVTTSSRNTSVIQVDGPASDLLFEGLFGWTQDDFLALNACDGNMVTSADSVFNTVAWYGPITRVTARGLYPRNCANVVRLLSGTPPSLPVAPIDQILIEHVVGTAALSHFLMSATSGDLGSTSPGSYGNIIFRDWALNATTNGYSTFGSQIGGTVASLTLAGWKLGDRSGYGSAMFLEPDAAVGQLKLVDWSIREDSSEGTGEPVVSLNAGTVDELTLDGINWSRSASTATRMIDVGGGVVNRIELTSVQANNVNNIVNIHGGNVGGVTSTGLVHRNAGGNASINVASGTLPRLRASGSDTALLAAGTITSKKTDGTEDS